MLIVNTLYLDYTDISEREKRLAIEQKVFDNQAKSDMAGMLVLCKFQ